MRDILAVGFFVKLMLFNRLMSFSAQSGRLVQARRASADKVRSGISSFSYIGYRENILKTVIYYR
jgi:hypothetical protein